MRASYESNQRFKAIFTLFAQCKEGFPLGGNWRHRRLMRGDKSALPIEMYLSPESERHMGRSLQRYTLNGLRALQGRNPKGAPRVSFRAPLTNRARSRTI